MKKKGNPLAEFLIGLAMLAAGGYWFLNSVSVSTGFYTLRLGGFYMNGGLVVVPFIAGVIWFCVNTDSRSEEHTSELQSLAGCRTGDHSCFCVRGNGIPIPLYQPV